MDTSTRTLLEGYTKPWWSPRPGNEYVVHEGHARGPGLLAWTAPGAFNLYWLLSGLPEPDDSSFWLHHRQNLRLLTALMKLGHKTVGGIPINEWAMTHKPKDFACWIGKNHHLIRNFPDLGGGITTSQQFCAAVQKAVAKLS